MSTSYQTLENMSRATWYNEWLVNKFKKNLSGEILEVGCGIGTITKELVKFGQVTAIDIDEKFLLDAKKLKLGVKFGKGDIEKGKYFFRKKEFDTIVCINVLEHIRNDKKALKNMYKLLKRKGRLILLVPAHPFLFGEIDRSIGHFRRYVKEDLIQLIKEAGFKVLTVKKINLLGALGWYLSSKLLKASYVSTGKIRVFNLLAPLFLKFESIIQPPLGVSILSVSTK